MQIQKVPLTTLVHKTLTSSGINQKIILLEIIDCRNDLAAENECMNHDGQHRIYISALCLCETRKASTRFHKILNKMYDVNKNP